jgi:hypothetical protein
VTLRDDIRLGVRWTTKEKLLRCETAAELDGFMAGLRDQGAETPELRNAAAVMKQQRGWK